MDWLKFFESVARWCGAHDADYFFCFLFGGFSAFFACWVLAIKPLRAAFEASERREEADALRREDRDNMIRQSLHGLMDNQKDIISSLASQHGSSQASADALQAVIRFLERDNPNASS